MGYLEHGHGNVTACHEKDKHVPRTLFACLFRYRARLPRPRPGKACPAACSKARAAGVCVQIGQTVKTSCILDCY